MSESQTTQCAHEACSCDVVGGLAYCSDACKQAHEEGKQDCPCDHPECAGH